MTRPEKNIMDQRKNYLIDKKFQLRHAISIMGTAVIIMALITGIIAFNAVYNNTRLSRNNDQLRNIVNDQSNIIIIQDNIVEALLTYSQAVRDPGRKDAIRNVSMNHAANMKTIRGNTEVINEIIHHNDDVIRYNTILLVAAAFFIILQALIFYFLIIRKTHRISGPIQVMSGYMRQIIEGNIPDTLRELRKKDELKEFYALFGEMVKKIRQD